MKLYLTNSLSYLTTNLRVPEGVELSKFTPNPKQQNPHARKKKKIIEIIETNIEIK